MEKKAFVFDTNFIIQYQKLDEVIDNLKDSYVVYVTEISVEERISQQIRQVKERYEKLEKLKNESNTIATISLNYSFDELKKQYRERITGRYNQVFGDHIIPFSESKTNLQLVFERACMKIPPFATENGSSDKGFKDTLLWLALIEYFSNNGENEILFVTEDACFHKNQNMLIDEFNKKTGKRIIFQNNAYYKELLHKDTKPVQDENLALPNVDELKEEIEQIFDDICYVSLSDGWGFTNYEKRFSLLTAMDEKYVESIFQELKSILRNYLFDKMINLSTVLDKDGRIIDLRAIPVKFIQNALDIYEKNQKSISRVSATVLFNSSTLSKQEFGIRTGKHS